MMITDLFQNLFSTPTDVRATAGTDYKSYREEMLGINSTLDSQEVFYNRGPRGEHFYGTATLEQLNNVHLHYDSEAEQTSNGSKMRITNGASKDIWINYQSSKMIWPQTLKIAAGQTADYNIPAGQEIPGVRYWPKYDCDEDGQNCTMGESGGPNLPCPAHGCSPPIDSKFEATWAAGGSTDWYDSSQVDGWTLPYYMQYNCDGDAGNSGKLNC